MSTVIEVDSRKRVSLGQTGELAERYLVEVGPAGVITLTPAVVLSEEELRLLQHPEIIEAIEESRRRVDAGYEGAGKPVRKRRPQ